MPVPQDTQPLQPTTAKERVLQTLAQWLVDGTLEPGERLYDEQLSRYFQVSRTPVREALQVLAEKGLVEILPGRGSRPSTLRRCGRAIPFCLICTDTRCGWPSPL